MALAFPDAVPVLRGDGVMLRAMTEDDIPAWFARASDRESAALAGDPVAGSIAEGPAWLQRHRERFRQRMAIRWSIVPNGATECLGSIGLVMAAPGIPAAELGIVIGRADWGRGFGTAAGRLVVRYAFDTLGLAEIEAEVLLRNLASRRLMEKLGFRFLRTVPESEPDGEACGRYGLAAG